MSSLVVGGLPIRIRPSNVSTDRFDATDRASAFDNTYRVSVTGGVRRDFHFTTPPVVASDFAAYMAVLSNSAPQLCSGDVISVPTMCCPEAPTWSPVRSQNLTYYVINFTLHEVQSAKALLRYSPGDTISGETFTRSTVGYSHSQSGGLVSNAINAKRDNHYIGGVRSLLLEDTTTQNILWDADFSNAAWVKTSITPTSGLPDPTGGSAAFTLTATGANGTVTQSLSAGSSISRAGAMWLRRRTGTGTIQMIKPDGSGYTTVTLTSNWLPFSINSTAGTGRNSGLKIVTSGDAVDAFISGLDDRQFSTSEILTTTVPVARGADSYQLPYTTPPQELSMYVKFIESGTIVLGGGRRVCYIGSAANATPQLTLDATGGFYEATHHNGTVQVLSALAVAPVVGDTVELLLNLFGDGSIQVTQSINGAASTSGAQSGANALATAWSAQLAWLNSTGATLIGFTAIQGWKIVAGSRSLSEMRAA